MLIEFLNSYTRLSFSTCVQLNEKKKNKSQAILMTHQAPSKELLRYINLPNKRVYKIANVRTPCVEIMITYIRLGPGGSKNTEQQPL